MVSGVGKTTSDRPADVIDSAKSGARGTGQRVSGEARTREDVAAEVSSQVEGLMERIRSADAVRKERVHQVAQKLQHGELLSADAIRAAAERIAEGGF